MRKMELFGFSALAGTMAVMTAPVMAQQQAQGQQAQVAVEEIVVTGSRVIQNGLQAPTPITVVAVDSLKDSTPGDFYMALTQLPVFSGSSSPATASFGTTGSTVGGALANLRGLGSTRTLILLNGRRVVPSTDGGSPDVALFPSPLISRVDIVTGGASAAYGSDAVSGVVNFVLNTNYEGIKGEIQGGISSRGDMPNYLANLQAGMSFGGGRGHIIVAGEINNSDGLIACDRKWACEDRWTLVNNGTVTTATATTSNTVRVMAQNVKSSRMAIGGLIFDAQPGAAAVLSNIAFGPGGVPQPFIKGDKFNPTTMVGGSGDNGGDYVTLFGGRTQHNVFANTTYDVTDDIEVFLEGSYGHTFIDDPSFLSREAPGTENFTIFSGNPYLPASIQQIMTAKNIASFGMGRLDPDFVKTKPKWNVQSATPSPLEYTSINQMARMATGLTGKLGSTGWSFDANFSYGWNRIESITYNDPILEYLFLASDAVLDPATGSPVCRIKLQNPTSTDPVISRCEPANLFGNGSPSAASMNYFLGTADAWRVNRQTYADVAVRGEPFSMWAGPASLAVGATYRQEKLHQDADPLSKEIGGPRRSTAVPAGFPGRVGAYRLTNTPALEGEIDVKEGFSEVLLPLAKDAAWAKALDFNGAVRYTDYNTSGTVTTWKAGVVYEAPIEGLRIRGTRSRDIRAGNMSELFTVGSGTALTVNDPFRGGVVSSSGQTIARGNPNIKPEKADTTTVGFTYQPEWFDGLGVSVDWYNIDIKDSITSLGAQNIVNQCFAGVTELCPLIQRDPNGVISYITNQTVNAAFSKNTGVDAEINYGTQLSDIVDSWDGNVVLRALVTYIGKRDTQTIGTVPAQTHGQLRWRANLTARYENGPFSLTLTERYIGNSLIDQNILTSVPTNISPEDNTNPSIMYTNLTTRYKVGEDDKVELFLSINNLFDKDPPPKGTFGTAGSLVSSQSNYDYNGRAFTLGVRFSY